MCSLHDVLYLAINRDHAAWGDEQVQHAQKEIARQSLNPVPKELVETYHAEAAENWNKFYTKNENKFFKDRHWLRIEFPELFQMIEEDVRVDQLDLCTHIFCVSSNPFHLPFIYRLARRMLWKLDVGQATLCFLC